MTNDRKIIFHGKNFTEFYVERTTVVQEKIEFVLKIVRTVDKIPKKYFDHFRHDHHYAKHIILNWCHMFYLAQVNLLLSTVFYLLLEFLPLYHS